MINARTQAKTDTQTNALAQVTWPKISDSRRWVALLVSGSVEAGLATLSIVAIDSNSAETVLWTQHVEPIAPAVLPFGQSGGLRLPPNQDLVVRLTAAGAGNIGHVNVLACGE